MIRFCYTLARRVHSQKRSSLSHRWKSKKIEFFFYMHYVVCTGLGHFDSLAGNYNSKVFTYLSCLLVAF